MHVHVVRIDVCMYACVYVCVQEGIFISAQQHACIHMRVSQSVHKGSSCMYVCMYLVGLFPHLECILAEFATNLCVRAP